MNNPREKMPESDCQLFVLTKAHPKKALAAGFGTGSCHGGTDGDPGFFFRFGSELPVDEILFWADSTEKLEKRTLTCFLRDASGKAVLWEDSMREPITAEPTGLILGDMFAPLTGEAFRLIGRDACTDEGVTSRAEWERLHGPVTLTMPSDADAAKPLRLWPFPGCNRTTWTLTSQRAYDDMLGDVPPEWMCSNAFMAGEPHEHRDTGESVHVCFVDTSAGIFCRLLTAGEFATCRATPAA